MPADTATLQAQVDALNRALASGVRSVTIGGQTTTFNTTASLIEARDDAQTRLANAQAAAAGRRRNSRILLYYNGRGY